MRTALTGTPGTGKSTLARRLERGGVSILRVDTLANEHDALSAYDRRRDTREVDLSRLARGLPADGPDVLVGHLAHRLPVDRVVVLRCHPETLRDRLKARGWPPAKVQENVEAEALGVITCEALERADTYEVDTTSAPVEEAAQAVQRILRGDGESLRAPRVDWSEVILEWF